MNKIELYQGDCLEIMDKLIEEGIKVDAIITDPPYGTTACKWDSVIPFDEMWSRLKQLKRDDRTPIVLFGSEPFSSHLRLSNIKEYKYDWIWQKSRFANQMMAKKQPLKIHELISIFYKKQTIYNPQGLIDCNKITKQGSKITDNNGGGTRKTSYVQTHTNYPKTIQPFKSEGKTVHSTQKPVALIEYLIKTYTNEHDTVLDFTMGSGTTGVACKNLNRNFIGIELDENYFEIAKNRIENTETNTEN
jgi:site-specific DNA-methyltransferase (adenine-specific)